MRRIPKPILRGAIVLELAGIAYIATYAALNAPAFAAQVRFAVSGHDLSGDVAGSYVPIEEIPQPAAEASNFPYTSVVLRDAATAANSAAPAPSSQPTTPSSAASRPAVTAIDPSQFVPNTVTVPRIGVRAPIVEVANNTEKVQQEGLARGVIHIYGTPQAGQPGNAFFAGHSSDWFGKPGKYKTVFALLPEVHEGDYFIISDASTMHYFRIVETVITGPNDTTVLERGRGGDEAFASIQTSYPVGAAGKRFVAVGKLERTVQIDNKAL